LGDVGCTGAGVLGALLAFAGITVGLNSIYKRTLFHTFMKVNVQPERSEGGEQCRFTETRITSQTATVILAGPQVDCYSLMKQQPQIKTYGTKNEIACDLRKESKIEHR
jgi:hypothetical protein